MGLVWLKHKGRAKEKVCGDNGLAASALALAQGSAAGLADKHRLELSQGRQCSARPVLPAYQQ